MAEEHKASEAARREEEILAFWDTNDIFKKTLEKPAPKGDFVFYEGPPTANGKPGIHHLEARAFKDVIPRYKTMRGYRVERRAGWDTHGLPVELEVEKQLGFSGKKDIETYGIAAFNKKCRESVLAYIDLWGKFTKRIGYWVDARKAYFTFNPSYMEAVWAVFKRASADNRLYRDYRIVPWCPRCGTALSAHELAQGYADVKDLTVTAKFRVTQSSEAQDLPEGTYLLAWTTTPWTLPGNVGLAVGPDISYSLVVRADGYALAATSRLADLGLQDANRIREYRGSELVGIAYEPLYPYAKDLASEGEQAKFANAYKVYEADFVNTEDGTGIVHTAVMYGQDDFELGSRVGLPKVHLVAADGRFVEGTGDLAGRAVADEDVAVDIIKDLTKRNLLFAKGKHEHSYPFCWRCKTRLIYYARDSWYLRMHDLRDTLVAENQQVHWEPEYLRDGRMGEWLANAKDWAVSRERYWGTPLPVWQSKDGNERVVIGSVEELREHTVTAGNTYYVMRHGQAQSNVEKRLSSDPERQKENHLTETGKQQAREGGKKLKQAGIEYIYTSPFARTRETAELVAETLGLSKDKIIVEDRLHEVNVGAYDGKSLEKFHSDYPSLTERAHTAPEGGETLLAVRKRAGAFLFECETRHQNARILIVTHGDVMRSLRQLATAQPIESLEGFDQPPHATPEPLPFVPFPHNDDYALDLHRPYIDAVQLRGTDGQPLARVPDVLDVWFDSGAMPFAQAAGERGDTPLERYLERVPYPADFISEAIDQTRGWFYTLLAIGVLMGRGRSYKNVISLGHLLDSEGQKMSKSKGNVIDPWQEMEQWGVDVIRFWMYSVSQAGDTKNYDEKTVREAAKVLTWFENSAQFYTLYKNVAGGTNKPQVIDAWLRARLDQVVAEVTTALDAYRPFEGARALRAFSEDLSQWYVRRIRDRARDGDAAAIETLRDALHVSARLLAPFTPFAAESLFRSVRREGDPESVHLAMWPQVQGKQSLLARVLKRANPRDQLIADMVRVRELASEALQLRQRAGRKVRQPLAQLAIPGELPEPLAQLLADEVNVKRVAFEAPAVDLDTELTPELITEGDEREMARAVAQARKTEGFAQGDHVETIVREGGAYAVELSTGTVHFDLKRHAT